MEQPFEEDAFSKLHELYPSLSPDDLKIAETNLKQYLKLALRVYERISRNPAEYARVTILTASKARPTMEERSNDNLKS